MSSYVFRSLQQGISHTFIQNNAKEIVCEEVLATLLNKPTYGCSVDEQAMSTRNEFINIFLARLVKRQVDRFIPNHSKLVLEEDQNIIIYGLSGYFMKDEIVVKNSGHFIKAKSNRDFWPTSYEDSQPNGFERLSLGEKLKDSSDVVIAVALIQGIDDEDQRLLK